MADAYDYFISYSHRDEGYANVIYVFATQITKKRCFLAKETISAGQRWRTRLLDALRQSNALIVLWSRQSSRSEWVAREIDLGVEMGKGIYPFKMDETELADTLAEYQAVDAGPLSELVTLKRELDHAGAKRDERRRRVQALLARHGLEADDDAIDDVVGAMMPLGVFAGIAGIASVVGGLARQLPIVAAAGTVVGASAGLAAAPLVLTEECTECEDALAQVLGELSDAYGQIEVMSQEIEALKAATQRARRTIEEYRGASNPPPAPDLRLVALGTPEIRRGCPLTERMVLEHAVINVGTASSKATSATFEFGLIDRIRHVTDYKTSMKAPGKELAVKIPSLRPGEAHVVGWPHIGDSAVSYAIVIEGHEAAKVEGRCRAPSRVVPEPRVPRLKPVRIDQLETINPDLLKHLRRSRPSPQPPPR